MELAEAKCFQDYWLNHFQKGLLKDFAATLSPKKSGRVKYNQDCSVWGIRREGLKLFYSSPPCLMCTFEGTSITCKFYKKQTHN